MFRKASADLGYHPFYAPTANLPRAYKNPDGVQRGPCTYCGFCERFGCEVGAKADPTNTVIPVALKTGKFKIIDYANAFTIKHDGKNGQSVLYYDSTGRIQEQPADVIVLGAFVFNNVRLLLASKLGQPYDPVANTGAVGRNYAYQTGGGGASAGSATGSSIATWAPARTLSRSTTSTPTTSTTQDSVSSAAAPSASARVARARSRA